LRWEIAQSLRGALFFMAIAPFIFILGLMPVIGPVLGGLWGAWALTFQQTEPTLTRRGLSFAARREWHRFWRAESYGFGLVGLLVLLIPLLQFALTSVLTVGATLMVLELEAIAPSAPNPQGVVSPRP
jgi:CysZ protein